MSQHTPGPWRAYAPIPSERPEYTIRAEAGPAGITVASVRINADNRADADATLIAAAPGLLETLVEVEDALGCDRRFNGGPLHLSVRAAIAGAEPRP